MGMSIKNQIDSNKYFCLSSIDKSIMRQYGLKMTMSELKNKARKTLPYAEIFTGQTDAEGGQRRKTKIYRYEDFKEVLTTKNIIEELMLRNNLTQSEFAERFGYTKFQISRWLSEETRPSAMEYNRLLSEYEKETG